MKRRLRLMAAVLATALFFPSVAFAAPIKRVDIDGSVPSKWDLPKPPVVPHPDVPPIGAGSAGDGYNSIGFGLFDDGDIVVGLGGGSITGHAGEWDAYYSRGSIYDNCIWSAQKSANRVLREDPVLYRTYDRAYGLWVPSVSSSRRVAARNYCRAQNGEPYVITSSKSNQSQWYCSKLPWASYKYTSNIDLDYNGGYYVWPEDLVNDSQTSVFASSN